MEQTETSRQQDVDRQLLEVALTSESYRQTMRALGRDDEQTRQTTLNNHISLGAARGQLTTMLQVLRQVGCDASAGPILDLGCGRGNFVYCGLMNGLNSVGIDPDGEAVEFFRYRIQLSGNPPEWAQRCIVADGQDLPFETDHFAVVHSNYVLEHIVHVGKVLREAVRVTRQGGWLYLKAQDARISYEGHYCIPWLPFLPRRLAEVWTAEFGASGEFLDIEDLPDVTSAQVVAALEAMNCRIVHQDPAPQPIVRGHWQWRDEEDVRQAARQAKELFDSGRWPKQSGGIWVVAQKLPL